MEINIVSAAGTLLAQEDNIVFCCRCKFCVQEAVIFLIYWVIFYPSFIFQHSHFFSVVYQ